MVCLAKFVYKHRGKRVAQHLITKLNFTTCITLSLWRLEYTFRNFFLPDWNLENDFFPYFFSLYFSDRSFIVAHIYLIASYIVI